MKTLYYTIESEMMQYADNVWNCCKISIEGALKFVELIMNTPCLSKRISDESYDDNLNF